MSIWFQVYKNLNRIFLQIFPLLFKIEGAFKEDPSESHGGTTGSQKEDAAGFADDKHGGEPSTPGEDEKFKTFNGFKFRYGPTNNGDKDNKSSKEKGNSKYVPYKGYNNKNGAMEENEEDSKKPKKKKERKKIFPEDTDSSDSPSNGGGGPSKSRPEGGANFGVSDFTNSDNSMSSSNNHHNSGGGGGSSSGGLTYSSDDSVTATGGQAGDHKVHQSEKEDGAGGGGTAPLPFEPEEKLSYHPTKLPHSPHFYNNKDSDSRNHEIKELQEVHSFTGQKQNDRGESRDTSPGGGSSYNIQRLAGESTTAENVDSFNDDHKSYNQGHPHHHVKGFSDNHATFRIHSKQDVLHSGLSKKSEDVNDEQ